MSSPQTRCETRNSRDYSPPCCIAPRWAKWPTLYYSAAIASSRSECSRRDISFDSRFWSRHCARLCFHECNRRGRLQIEPLEQRVKIRFVDDQGWTSGGKLLAFVECLK